MGTTRKELVWNIKRGLFKLSSNDLHTVARGLSTEAHEVSQLKGDEEGCIDYVITYMGSRELLELEDEGMTNLLMLDDFVCKLINENVCVELPVDKWGDAKTHKTHSPELPTIDVDNMSQTNPHSNITVTPQYPHSNTHIHANTQSVEDLRKMYDELGQQLRKCAATANSQTPAPNPQGESMPQPLPHRVSGTMVPLRDLPYL